MIHRVTVRKEGRAYVAGCSCGWSTNAESAWAAEHFAAKHIADIHEGKRPGAA